MNTNEAQSISYNQPREWLLWIVATAGGWLLGSVGNFAISVLLRMTGLDAMLNADPAEISQTTALLFLVLSLGLLLVVGLAIGALQWLVLRRHLTDINRWILFTALGFALGSFASLAFMGLGVGLMQWLLLRRALNNKTGWWPVISAVAWPVGYMFGGSLGVTLGAGLGSPFLGSLLGAVFIGSIIGSITGAVLLWILRENQDLLTSLRQETEEAKS
jgi:hypothetical protein